MIKIDHGHFHFFLSHGLGYPAVMVVKLFTVHTEIGEQMDSNWQN